MFHFSNISRKRLNTCHTDLQALFEQVILGYDCTIVCGHRTQEEQDLAYANGYSHLRWPNSKHNSMPSMAVDVVPYGNGRLDWGKLQGSHFAGYVKGMADQLYMNGTIHHRIRCGVDWDNDQDVDDTQFWDSAHFELIV